MQKISKMLQAEEVERVLTGGERAVGLGEGDLQMGHDLGFGSIGRQRGWWASLQQCGSEDTLSK